MGTVFPDDFEVEVRDRRDGMELVGVVALVSPGNKGRDEERRAFVAKCASHIHRGIGVVVVDIVTPHGHGLHGDLLAFLGGREGPVFAHEAPLSAVAYRSVLAGEKPRLDIWHEPLALGEQLPLMPLPLRGAKPLPLDLEAAYQHAREDSGL
jgi:hypothetical protein